MSDETRYQSFGMGLVMSAVLGFPSYVIVWTVQPALEQTFIAFWIMLTVGLIMWSIGRIDDE